MDESHALSKWQTEFLKKHSAIMWTKLAPKDRAEYDARTNEFWESHSENPYDSGDQIDQETEYRVVEIEVE